MPPRKTSRPPPYAARNNSTLPIPPALKNLLRRDKLRLVVVGILGFLTVLWLLGRTGNDGGSAAQKATTPVPKIPKVAIGSGPPVVIVTVIDGKADPTWAAKIKKNREDYAKKHGYLTFFPTNTQYPTGTSPLSWSKVPALRHAMTLFPGSTYFWFLDSTALIMNQALDLQSHLLAPAKLEKLMIVNEPVVPPDSVIKTFGNLKGDRIDFIVTQDKEGLTATSMVVRNGEWAKYFLDAWFDPIYRSYNFQRAEIHALEHIVQWHGTILAKLALVPQNLLNAYGSGPAHAKYGTFKEGDLVANFPACARDNKCADEMKPFFDILDGKSTGSN
ncbi:alpha-1,6-mannosyltransferas-like protein subunit [Massarina eburnea CBS 473.64]|uniref:Alpha-1,6-mannosyltransferas-like protein subunit n=1 Tax=Massarina eburnea CBS 473.64 TaxID=1395130 RepID=A0A6A6RXF7_9PLEO|nr:alpha-1,6-mannosyltransferas-like protein subunit [Massarina eburnea CBS 473.64]